MLTAFQCSTAAYRNEYGELFCLECVTEGSDDAVDLEPVIVYALDEEQSAYAEDYEWPSLTHEGQPDDDDEHSRVQEYHAECEPALFDVNGHELLPEYHYGHDVDDDVIQNPPVPRWVPCSKCGAGDGEPHRPTCPLLPPGARPDARTHR